MALDDKQIESKLKDARGLFPLLSEYTFLNCASRPPLGIPIRKRLDEFYDNMMHIAVDDIEALFAPIESSRQKLALLFGCQPAEIAITTNTSYGINLAAWGLGLKPGDTVLLIDIEFPANIYPFLKLKETGVNIKFVKSHNGQFDVSDIELALTPDVKLFSTSWVQFFNGARNDLEALGQLCSEREVFFSVDGIQGAGAIALNLSQTGADLFSAGAEKWLLAPCGVGFTYLANRSDHLIKNHYAGWLGVDWGGVFTSLLDYTRKFKNGAARFEIGTYPYQEIWGFEAALDIILEIGIDNISHHNIKLLDLLIGYLKDSGSYRIVSPLEMARRSSILSFTCDNPEHVYKQLNDNRIVTSYREGAIRVSPHFYNNLDDIELLIEVLRKIENEGFR